MKPRMMVFGVLALLVSGLPVSAHHAIAVDYDGDKPVTLRGTLTKMEWANPHGWIHIDVKEPDGKVVNWAIETASVNQMMRRGLRKADFPIGVELIVNGYLARNGTPTAGSAKVVFAATGRSFDLGEPTR